MTTEQRAWHADIMGMPISIRLRGDGVQSATIQSCVDRVFDLLRRVDSVFSTYRSDSELMRHRRGELPLNACDPVVREVFELCAEAATRTEGWFDAQTDTRATRATRTTHAGRVLDPTGVVKGWAVQRASELLAE
ncbi:MAG: FAD:protein FMN transferase, partial [Mycobacteriaceae bacterium]